MPPFRQHDETRPPLPGHGRMENYTVAFLISAGCLLFTVLFALWALWGISAPLLAAFLADRWLRRLHP